MGFWVFRFLWIFGVFCVSNSGLDDWFRRQFNAAQLVADPSQDPPRRRNLQGGHEVCGVLLGVQAGFTHILVVDFDRINIGVPRGLVVPDDVEVELDVIEFLENGLGASISSRRHVLNGNRQHLGLSLWEEDHADDADLLLNGVERRVGLVRLNPLVGLGVHHVPLGRGVQGLEQATLRRLQIVLKARLVAAGHEVLEVPLDRVPFGARVVFAQRDERDRKDAPDVLTARQVRAVPAIVLIGDVEGHRL